MYVLDTNVVSELRRVRAGKASPAFVAWEKASVLSTLFVSVITLMELELGVLAMERRDPAQGAPLRLWLDQAAIPGFAGRILTIDSAVARRCARLHVPDRRPERDAMIAATALEHGMTVVTRNIRDFAAMGVGLVDPWAG